MQELIRGMILNISSLIILVMLMIQYFNQKRYHNISNKLFVAILYIALYMIVTDIGVNMLNYYTYDANGTNIGLRIFYEVHWISGPLFALLYFIYTLIYLHGYQEKQLKDILLNHKTCLIATIITIVSCIVAFFIPFTYRSAKNAILQIPGTSAVFSLMMITLLIISVPIIYILSNTKKDKYKLTYIIFITIFVGVILVFQVMMPDIAFCPTGCTAMIYLLYFLVENPDIYQVQELEKLKNEIERSNRAKSDFLSNMSHEIRTPMNSIVGLSNNLLNDEFDEKVARQDIQHIYTAGNNLLDIIDNILDISKIESGTEELEEKEYSIATVIKELSTMINIRIGTKPIKFVIDIGDKIPSKMYGDQTKITQVLINILNNSVKYTEVGKIKLTITCDINKENANLHFKIADTGFGIKPEDYEKMFTKFNRLESATSKEIEGTGLGLVITKQYVELMGGKIWFESEYQAGTTFYIELPQKIIDQTTMDLNKEETKEDEVSFTDFSGRKVLLVDDNKLNLVVASRLLEPYKINVTTLNSGKDCIADIKKGNKYDLILLDHMMPEMDGIEVLHVLRKLEDYYDIPPIVVLTANAISGMREMYLKEGFNEYISKPIDVKRLDEILKKFVKPVYTEPVNDETNNKKDSNKNQDNNELGVLERLRMRE